MFVVNLSLSSSCYKSILKIVLSETVLLSWNLETLNKTQQNKEKPSECRPGWGGSKTFCPYFLHLHTIYKICVNRQCLIISLLPSFVLLALACCPFVDNCDCEPRVT